uniref:putative thiamine transporter SLC35F3 isoform X1 n=1 Tax=Oncorhynchus gorbuscha TaxID=8017 RepID=UPI001EAF785D|nr:putative thiamine transporter SLC35F3 isoform X1 [Oncorhynchus gorbuscha]
MKKQTAKVSPSPITGPAVFLLPTPQEHAERQRGPQHAAEDGQDGGQGGGKGGDQAEECVEKREDSKSRCARCPLRAMCRAVWGLVLGCCVALAWAVGTHSAKQSLEQLHAPFFTIWFCSTWNLLLFPLYYLGHLLGAEQRQWPTACFRQCSGFLVEEDMTVRVLLKGAAPFSVLWSLSGYLYLLALCRISAGDASAILCCSQGFIFLLSWIGLNDRFMGVRIVAVILSITGIVMMAYADGFHSDSITGVALAVGSASTTALYKVLFRKRVGEVQPGTASVLLSCVGLCCCVLLSWVCVILYLTHVEYWPPIQYIPWDALCVMASLLLAFNVLVNLGSVLAYPSLISLGMLLSIPANSAVDFYVAAAPQLSQVRVAAAAIIGVGYLLLLLPGDWDDSVVHWIEGLWQGGWKEDSVVGEDGGADGGEIAKPKPKPKPAGIAALT